MVRLDLGARPLTILPASEFPSRADAYVCDNCRRDITRHLHRGRAHVWRQMGSERYRCNCGALHITGAVEWDHLRDWERKRRVSQTFGLGIIFSFMSSIAGLLAYLALHFLFGLRQAALITGLALTALPFVLVQLTFWYSVPASVRRTRFGSGIVSEHQ